MLQQRRAEVLRGGSLGFTPSLIEIIGWDYNAVLTMLSFRIRDGVWTAIIKADFGNTPMVAFLDVGSFGRCVEVTSELAAAGQLHWHRDKYPPKKRTWKKAS